MARLINEDLDLQGLYRVINALDGVNPQDYATVAQIAAEIAANAVTSLSGGGGTPMVGDIALVSGANVTLTENSGAGTITIASSGGGGGSAPGNSSLVYRYTVAGSDKASIDTGVDTPDAGSNDWTNGDLLEVFIVSRTDVAAAGSNAVVTLNNDSGANYWRNFLQLVNTTVSGTNSTGLPSITLDTHGDGGSANIAGQQTLRIPDFSGTTFAKTVQTQTSRPDSTAANSASLVGSWLWNNTAAITRLAVAAPAGAKLKVGSQLLIYKRLAS